MKNENITSIADATGVSEWWFTRNIIAGLFGIAASMSLAVAIDRAAENRTAAEPKSQHVTLATS
jgi:hypothetical protein